MNSMVPGNPDAGSTIPYISLYDCTCIMYEDSRLTYSVLKYVGAAACIQISGMRVPLGILICKKHVHHSGWAVPIVYPVRTG